MRLYAGKGLSTQFHLNRFLVNPFKSRMCYKPHGQIAAKNQVATYIKAIKTAFERRHLPFIYATYFEIRLL